MKIIIVGAGPCGLLMAHYLCRRDDCQVLVLEQRADPRSLPPSELRTYPIALQKVRGLHAIDQIPGLQAALEKKGVWTHGVCFHDNKTAEKTREIRRPMPSLTIDRNNIVLAMLEELETAPFGKSSSMEIRYQTKVQSVRVGEKAITVESNDGSVQKQSYQVLVAADGSKSTIRRLLVEQGMLQAREYPVDDEYKSLYLSKDPVNADSLPSKTKDTPAPSLIGDLVHGWMSGKHRVLMGPAVDGETFNGVITFPPGEDPFASSFQAGGGDAMSFFHQISPNSLSHYISSKEAKDIVTRPVCQATGVHMDRLHVGDSILFLGDSAHAVSASLGQGCNAALQDVFIFHHLLGQKDNNWASALEAFTESRLREVHALEEMSTYSNPRSSLMRVEFLVRVILGSLLPSWIKKLVLNPTLMDTMSEPGLSYTEVFEKCRWWTDRVKLSSKTV